MQGYEVDKLNPCLDDSLKFAIRAILVCFKVAVFNPFCAATVTSLIKLFFTSTKESFKTLQNLISQKKATSRIQTLTSL